MKKKLPDRYVFPAQFIYSPDQEISVVFPDLGCATSGTDDADALTSARELLGLVLLGMEEDGSDIPAPTPLDKIDSEPNTHTALIDVYMPSLRLAGVNKSVNRTVTLPAWLNALAIEKNVNFSQVLQTALKEQLHVAG